MADIAFVVGDIVTPTVDDQFFYDRATALGYTYNTYIQSSESISDNCVVYLRSSGTFDNSNVINYFLNLDRPLGMVKHTNWDALNLTTADGGAQGGTTVAIIDSAHSLAGGLSGTATSNTSGINRRVNTGTLPASAEVIATNPGTGNAMIVYYESGAILATGTAVNVRVLHGLVSETGQTVNLTANGITLVDALLTTLVESALQTTIRLTDLDVLIKSVPIKTTSLDCFVSFPLGTATGLDFIIQDTATKTTLLDLILTEITFSGTALDAIAYFESQEFLTTNLDFLIQVSDNELSTDLDFLVLGINPVFTHLDFYLSKEGVLTTGLDTFIASIPILSTGLDTILVYGPDIDISTGPLVPKWFTREVNMRIASITREYYRTEVYATESGVQIDPTSYTVEFAITANDDDGLEVEPVEADWVEGEWDTNNTVTPPVYYAQVLIGRDTNLPLDNGSYHIWRRINTVTEAPVKMVGRIDVT